jgi:hypothetical protein
MVAIADACAVPCQRSRDHPPACRGTAEAKPERKARWWPNTARSSVNAIPAGGAAPPRPRAAGRRRRRRSARRVEATEADCRGAVATAGIRDRLACGEPRWPARGLRRAEARRYGRRNVGKQYGVTLHVTPVRDRVRRRAARESFPPLTQLQSVLSPSRPMKLDRTQKRRIAGYAQSVRQKRARFLPR